MPVLRSNVNYFIFLRFFLFDKCSHVEVSLAQFYWLQMYTARGVCHVTGHTVTSTSTAVDRRYQMSINIVMSLPCGGFV